MHVIVALSRYGDPVCLVVRTKTDMYMSEVLLPGTRALSLDVALSNPPQQRYSMRPAMPKAGRGAAAMESDAAIALRKTE